MHDTDEIDLSTYWKALKKNWLLLMLVSAIGLGIAALYTWRVSPVYEGRATILLLPDMGGAGGGPEGAVVQLLSKSANPLDIYDGMIKSHPSLLAISRATGLDEEKASNYIDVKKDQEKNQLVISAHDQQSNKALVAVKSALRALTDLNGAIQRGAARQIADTLKPEITAKRSELEASEQAFAAYSAKMKTPINPTDPSTFFQYLSAVPGLEYQLGTVNRQIAAAQSQAVAMATLALPTALPAVQKYRDQIQGLTLKYSQDKTRYEEGSPVIHQDKDNIAVTQQHAEAEIVKNVSAVQQGLDPSVVQLVAQRQVLEWQLAEAKKYKNLAPNEAVTVWDMYENTQILGDVVKGLEEKYEESMVKSDTDQPRWAVLEPPFIEEKPINKHYGKMGGLGLAFGLLLSSVYAISKERKRSVGQAPSAT